MGHGGEVEDADAVVPVGAVPDEVLLLCGRPDSVPSAWWTPTLVDHDPDTADRLVAAAADLLVEHGVRDPATGGLSGLLGTVAAIVADARVLLLLETERPGAPTERRSVVVAEHAAVLDRQDPDGFHDLLLAGARATAALLADLLTPSTSTAVAALTGRHAPAEVAAALPEHERTATIRITRVAAGDDPTAHMVTLVDHPDGAVACWAAPDGTVEVQQLDPDAATDLSLALLGAEVGDPGEVAGVVA